MNSPLGVSPSKGNQGTTRGKETVSWPRWESNPRPLYYSPFFFYKNVVFPAQAEYFFADFRLKMFLYYSCIIFYYISVLEFIGVSITSF